MVRTGLLRSLMPSLGRLVVGLWLRYLGSRALSSLFSLDSCYALTASYEPPLPQVASQARLESDVLDPQLGVTTASHQMFQALGGPDRSPAVTYVSQ